MKKSFLKRGTKTLKRSPLKKVSKNNKVYSKDRVIYGTKLLTLTQADIKYSLWLRSKRNYTCEKCGIKDTPPTSFIQCSHYIGRAEKATRYDEDNTDVFCDPCHKFFEKCKNGEYKTWKIKQLGEEKHKRLLQKANKGMSEKDSILECMNLIKNYE